MTPIRLIAAAAVSALIAMPAMAQSPTPTQPESTPVLPADSSSVPPTTSDDQTLPSAVPEEAMPAPSAAAASTDASATVTTRLVTNGPVADTAENRAKFQPLSNAGRRTKPAGN